MYVMTCAVLVQSLDLQTYQIQAFTTTGGSGQAYEFFTPGHVGAASRGYAPVVAVFKGLTINQLVPCRQAGSMCANMRMSSLHTSTVNQVDCYPQISGKVSALALHCAKRLLLTSMKRLACV